MVKIHIVSYGFYFHPDTCKGECGDVMSYWDFDVAMRTFATYQAMVPDWISLEVYIPEGEDVP